MIGGAILVVTALMTVLMALTAGIQLTIMENSKALASGHLNIAGFYKISQTSATPMVTKKKELFAIAREAVPEAKLIIERVKGYGKLISDTDTIQLPVWGVDMKTEHEVLGKLAVAEGDIFGLEKRGTIVIFESQAKKLKVHPGDTITVSMPTYRNVYNTKDLRVVAVLKDLGFLSSFSVFMDADDLREVYQTDQDVTGQLMIFLKNPSIQNKVEDRLRRVLSDKGFRLMEKEAQPFWLKFDRVTGESWTGQKLDVTTWQDETAFAKWIIDIFHALTFVLTAVLMFIVVIGLMNVLWISIRERTAEIGTLRAIGLQRRSVLLMFVLEALVLSVAATVAGVLAGALFSGFVNLLHIEITADAFRMFLMSERLTLAVQAGDVLVTFFVITFFVTLGALYPSYKASKMKPLSAIQHIV
jgi:ABC-type lipoprotein release transport system permease subunit